MIDDRQEQYTPREWAANERACKAERRDEQNADVKRKLELMIDDIRHMHAADPDWWRNQEGRERFGDVVNEYTNDIWGVANAN